MKTETQVIKLPKPLIDKLKLYKHPGQSFAGVIEELITELEKYRNDKD